MCVCAMTRRLRTTSPWWPGGSGTVLRPKSCVRKIFLPPYLMASYFCSSNYNRLVLLRYESPFFSKCFKTPLSASCACTLHHITLYLARVAPATCKCRRAEATPGLVDVRLPQLSAKQCTRPKILSSLMQN